MMPLAVMPRRVLVPPMALLPMVVVSARTRVLLADESKRAGSRRGGRWGRQVLAAFTFQRAWRGWTKRCRKAASFPRVVDGEHSTFVLWHQSRFAGEEHVVSIGSHAVENFPAGAVAARDQ